MSTPVRNEVRTRKTSARVKAMDAGAGVVIRVGGIGIIGALVLIMVFIVKEALPLFSGADGGPVADFDLVKDAGESPEAAAIAPAHLGVDEYRRLVSRIGREPAVLFLDARTGLKVATAPLDSIAGDRVSSVSCFTEGSKAEIVVGTESGRVAFGNIAYDVSYPDPPPPDVAALPPGRTLARDGAVFEMTENGLCRRVSPSASLSDAVRIGPEGVAVVSAARQVTEDAEVIAVALAGGGAKLRFVSSEKNLLTDETTTTAEDHDLGALVKGNAIAVLLSNIADEALVACDDGQVVRFDVEKGAPPREVERFDVVPSPGDKLTAFGWILGQQSVLVGDSSGACATWFRIRDADAPDGWRTVRPHVFESHAAPITAQSTSPSDKGFLTGSADGRVKLRHMTAERTLLDLDVSPGTAVRRLAYAPKLDGFVAEDASGRVHVYEIRNPHPEATLGTLFGRTWYEGYEKPDYAWQSTGGTDDVEPKLSLVPLAFGTMKGTLYAMLFAVPIALLAAIYTSQFLHPRVRNVVKPAVELMASLPSVVLGFIAALILSPLITHLVPAILVAFGIGPLVLVAAGALWERMPLGLTARAAGAPKLLILVVLVAAAAAASLVAGPVAESFFFDGDYRAWLRLDGGSGTRVFSVALFLVLLLVLWPAVVAVRKRIERRSPFPNRRVHVPATFIETAAVALVATILLAPPVERALFGGDFRTFLLGAEGIVYDPRNSLVVGFAMGFAVIPIIYAITEDSLSSVPEHLRSGSLACGATHWQTAVRIVIPAALSGIFSAIMVGFGRAVGETMIVLMATGNTPVLDWSIFNGFRALSATIATELGEAPEGSTLYRVLFLAAVLLFGVTFVINTAAELIRIRIRARRKAL